MKRLLPVGIVGLSTLAAVCVPAAAAVNAAVVDAPLVKTAEFVLREPRHSAALAAQGDYLYVVGGNNRSTLALDRIERLNTRTGASEPFAKLTTGRLWAGAVQVDDQLYVIGGARAFGRRAAIESSVEIVDLATGRVSAGPGMPWPRCSFASVRLGSKLYVIGGLWQRGPAAAETNTMEVLDLTTGQWSSGAPMPKPRQCSAAVVDGGFIVVPGGYNGQRKVADVDVFNPRENTWRSLPPLHRSVSGHSVAFAGHHIFLFGDFDDAGSLIAYDLVEKQSRSFTLDARVARFTSALAHDGRIYVAGGRTASDLEIFDSVLVFGPAPAHR